jgi:hypothetical protein
MGVNHIKLNSGICLTYSLAQAEESINNPDGILFINVVATTTVIVSDISIISHQHSESQHKYHIQLGLKLFTSIR